MSESLRKKIVFVTLPLAIVWAIFSYPSKKTTSQPPAPDAAVSAETPVMSSSGQPAVKSTLPFDLKARRKIPWGDDPFRSIRHYSRPQVGGDDESTSLEWVLAGIIYGNQSPIAFVNSHMVGVGDKVGSATVIAIDRESVTLEYLGRTITLKLHKG